MPSLGVDVYGYKIRKPYESESEFFKKNPDISGIASEDGHIVLNPFSELSDSELDSVAKNEAARLYMREHGAPKFDVTEEQRRLFGSTPYYEDEEALRSTIASRILSGDPSAGDYTEDQRVFVDDLRSRLEKRQIWKGKDEAGFLAWYAETVKALGELGQKLDPNPDDPRHEYDYRGAYKAKAYPQLTEHGDYRWPDEFKLRGHRTPPVRRR